MKLHINLNNGYIFDGKEIKSLTLAKLNGVAEKIIANKLPERPYTYISYVLCAAIEEIGGYKISSRARAEYLEDNKITIPPIIKAMPMAEAASLLVEIHRTVWKSSIIKDQECACMKCGSTMITDIDLAKVKLTDKEAAKISPFRQYVEIDLIDGWDFVAPKLPNGQESLYAPYDGINFRKFTYVVPTMHHAIMFEKIAVKDVEFWRNIAKVTLHKVENDELELPKDAFAAYGIKLYDEILYSEDLGLIRSALRDSVPSLGFFYEEECPTCYKQTYVALEANQIFPL